ncbi:MAG: tRNA glutamyl-Q(34) synthetase GluQRS, partial [Gammaproteobacteria bacterium]|nr:tRNA glutamyl-Q(34) synthetase GluQRS [Gammaproteobacteria bacterium]
MNAATPQPSVRGRFAPTPSGPLHFGSLVAAFASALDARSRGGEWLLRIDDVDRARRVSGAAEAILDDLEAYGFVRDGAVRRQGDRSARYRRAVDTLLARGRAFPCACSRREVAHGSQDGRYPGRCRNGVPQGKTARSVRLLAADETIEFDDRFAGHIEQNLAGEVGDFVLWRADGIASYHLATVLDDAEDGITHVVRGADLLASTPRQICLQRLLGLPTPTYAHVPLV